MTFKERRRAKRVEANLALTIVGEAGEETGKTLNISTNGVYFQSPRFIDPLTKVSFEILLPKGEDGTSKRPIKCEGIVVRVEPEKQDPSVSSYNIAVFFTALSDASQKSLDSFVKQRLPAR
jgi:hypothetical protein